MKSGRPGGDGRAREARTKHTPDEEVGRYRGSSVTPVFQPNFLALVRGGRTQYLHPLWRTHHVVIDLQSSTHHEVLECRSAAAFKCINLLMHAKRNCGASAFPVVIILFSHVLCGVGCFFVTQSHSIKVSRRSALVIFSFFFIFCRSSTVIV